NGHCGHGEAERPARRKGLPAGQPGETPGYVAHGGAGEDVVVEVAVVRPIAAEQAVIVVDGAAQIDRTGGEIVVEDAVRAGGSIDDEEGQHFVERVGELCVETAGIDRIDGKTASGAVERP